MIIRNAINKDGSNFCSVDGINDFAMVEVPFNKQKGPYTNYVLLKNSDDPFYSKGLYFWDTSDMCSCDFETINGKDYIFVSVDNLFKVKGKN